MLQFNLIHQLFKAKVGLNFHMAGQDAETGNLPLVEFDIINELKYKPHQILKEYSDLGPDPTVEYKNPTTTDVQYSVVNKGESTTGNGIVEKKERLESLYGYIVSDEFQINMKKINIGFDIISPVTEIKISKEKFFERRFIFEIKYFWADVRTNVEGSFIETINWTNETP